MRNLTLAACLAVGLTLAGVGSNDEVRANHGFHGRHCHGGGFHRGAVHRGAVHHGAVHHGAVHRGGFHGGGFHGEQVARFAPSGRYYAPPVVVAPRYGTGVYGVPRFGAVPYGMGFNTFAGPRMGVGFGNVGFGNVGFGNVGFGSPGFRNVGFGGFPGSMMRWGF
jgi:hypothetical protein